MATKFAIFANGWGGEIYASYLKNRSWTMSLEIDAGVYGRVRETVRNLRSPQQFVHAFYRFNGIEMDTQTVESALAELYQHSPAFAIACSVYNQLEDGETDFDEEDYLLISPTFLSSNPTLPLDFIDAQKIGTELFSTLLKCHHSNELAQSIELNSVIFPVVWSKRISSDLRKFQISQAISKHCGKAEWTKLTGHSHAAIGNGHIGQKIQKFVTDYHSTHRSMPTGEFMVGGTAVKFN